MKWLVKTALYKKTLTPTPFDDFLMFDYLRRRMQKSISKVDGLEHSQLLICIIFRKT